MMQKKQPCCWCGGLYRPKGIFLHQAWCPSNPSSPKYRKEGQSSTQPSIEPKKGFLEEKGDAQSTEPGIEPKKEEELMPSKAQTLGEKELFWSIRELPLDAQKDLVEKVKEELEFDDVELKLSIEELTGIRELADENHISPIECIVEILRRAMKTKRQFLVFLEENDSQPLLGLETLISMGGDQGKLFEFVLNMKPGDLEALIDEFYEAQKAKGEKDEMRGRRGERGKEEDEEEDEEEVRSLKELQVDFKEMKTAHADELKTVQAQADLKELELKTAHADELKTVQVLKELELKLEVHAADLKELKTLASEKDEALQEIIKVLEKAFSEKEKEALALEDKLEAERVEKKALQERIKVLERPTAREINAMIDAKVEREFRDAEGGSESLRLS